MNAGSFDMSDASNQLYYYDRARNRQGPFAEAEFRRLIADGTIRRSSMIWYPGLADWRAAGEVDKFASLFAGQVPPSPVSPAYSAPIADPAAMTKVPAGALTASLPVWGLFGRCLLLAIGSVFVIPAPWTATAFYRYVGTHTDLPGGKRLTFAGQAGDIWFIFVAIAALSFVGLLIPFGNIFVAPPTWALTVQVIRWFCAKLGSEDGSVKLAFTGGIWNYIGWSALLYLSFITIIGWAWVFKFMMQWICRNVSGTVRFEFSATGLAILWRSLVLGFLSILIIPIPWLVRWYMAWFISQLHVVPADA
jgi:hypothetical protein